jgi:hypothetical protein
MSCLILSNQHKCSCHCGSIQFNLPSQPIEIAKCFCSICHGLYDTEYTPFSKYSLDEIIITNQDKIKTIRSSRCAIRGFCSKCNDPIYMLYDNSPNIWIVANTFQFPWDNIETYNIYQS